MDHQLQKLFDLGLKAVLLFVLSQSYTAPYLSWNDFKVQKRTLSIGAAARRQAIETP